MNILYCGDENILDGIMMSMLSLLENAREQLNIYILTAHIETDDRIFRALPEDAARFLDRTAKEYAQSNSVEVIDITDLYCAQPPTANLGTRFTPCCMLRLFADKVERLPGRMLYLDTDVICGADFSRFYHQDMGSACIAGVLDYYGSWFFRRSVFRRDYLNSGVLLLDLDTIRTSGLFARCRKMCAEKKMFMPDQSALNKLAQGKKICPRRYNDQRRLHEDTVFRHFTTTFRFFPYIRTVTVKPWDAERMHSVLGMHEYDSLLCRLEETKKQYQTYTERKN